MSTERAGRTHRRELAADSDADAAGPGLLHHAVDLRAVRRAAQWAHIGGGVCRVPCRERVGRLLRRTDNDRGSDGGQLLQEAVADLAVYIHARGRRAVLASIHRPGNNGAAGGSSNVGILKDNKGGLVN